MRQYALTATQANRVKQAPDESERDSVLKSLLPSANLAPDVSFHELAVQTAALIPSDLADLAMRGERAYLSRAAEQTYATHNSNLSENS